MITLLQNPRIARNRKQVEPDIIQRNHPLESHQITSRFSLQHVLLETINRVILLTKDKNNGSYN